MPANRLPTARATFLLLGMLPAALLVVAAPHALRGQVLSPATLRRDGDQHYSEESYALALDDYKRWLAQAPATAPDYALIEYRVAVALGKAQKWDQALAAWDTFLLAHKTDPYWVARAQYQRGLLLANVPHQGYKVGDKTYRGNDYPHTASSVTPECVWLQQDDAKAELAAFEASVLAFQQLPPPVRRKVADEEADLSFDLAKILPGVQPWGTEDNWKAADKTGWAVNPAALYDPAWPSPKKVLFLLARIPRLTADAHTDVLAEMARGLYVAQSHNGWARWEYDAKQSKNVIVQTIPYYKLDPIGILTRLADASPDDPQAPQIRLLVAQWTAQKGDNVAALALYRALTDRYPSSKWAEDARAAAQEIVRAHVSVSTSGPQPAGRPASVSVSSVNLKALVLRAYKIDLAAVLTAASPLNDPQSHFTDFQRNFGSLQAARALGPQVAEWTYKTKDKGDYQYVGETLTTPLSQTGAYLVEAIGDGGRVRGAAVVVLSDLALVKKVDKDDVLCFVADARTGQPVPHARVTVRETYNRGSTNQVKVTPGRTDADGVFTAARVRGENIYSNGVEAFASASGRRYALTSNNNWWYGGNDDGGNRDEIKVYAYTDRPVYRPKQTVYFRELLARRKGGSDFAPLVGVPVTISVSGPRGAQVYSGTVTSSPFGTVNGSFPLPTGAALGEYSVSVTVPNVSGSVSDSGGNRFRVEEYKKPEYAVKVTPSATQARFGDSVTATVNAAYYSGPPVAGAQVSYKVFRNPYYPQYHFPEPYDWFYRADDGDYQNQYASNGELVTQGTGTTDAKGSLPVSFVAAKGTRGYSGDYAYTVIADVTDASRRQITGEGVLHVTNQAFYAYLNIAQAFYQKGDKVPIELRTQDADQAPVSASGTLTVKRLTYEGSKVIETVVHTEPLTTDAEGKAFTTWTTDESGQFRLDFTARDKFEKPVVAQAPVWVDGADLGYHPFHVGGITLLTDKTTYQEGDTAHLLIVADQPGDWVLLTQETGNQILTRTLLHVAGRARTVDVPIVRAHVPNFALAAVAVRDYQFYQWNKELFVPPARQFVHMAVTGDKAEYKPGETGTFQIKTTNHQGLPVASEVSLAVVDSSVFYIQKEYAPDIRLFYYGQRRNINVNADTSQGVQPGGTVESDVPQVTYNPHGIHLPDFGRLPGDYFSPYYYGRYGYYGMDGSYGGRRGGFGGGYGGMNYDALENTTIVPNGGMVTDGGWVTGGALGFAVHGYSEVHKGSTVGLNAAVGVAPFVDKNGVAEAANSEHQQFAQARVRDYFPDTAFWTPAVVTDKATGAATVHVTFPDSLTTWKATARGLTTGVQVGSGDISVVTNKHLLVRLEAPRFFVERDTVTLSAIVRNDLATDKSVRVSLATTGPLAPSPLTPAASRRPSPSQGRGLGLTQGAPLLTLSPARNERVRERVASLSEPGEGASGTEGDSGAQTITVPAHSEKRVDWTESVTGDGEANVKMIAETDEESDAVSQTFPVLTYGVQKFVAQSGVMQADQTQTKLTIAIPEEHKPGSAALLIQINPSLAATALDALPYLADYPYGCVEQTLSRFVPSVLVAKTLRESGVDLDTLHQRALAMQEREQAGTPFGSGSPLLGRGGDDQTGYTYPTGTPGVMKTTQLAGTLWHTDRWDNPVFDPERLKSMTDEGLARLVSMQRGDGGWGWWGGSAASDPYMSAYAVWGLSEARTAGVDVPNDVLRRGEDFLVRDIEDRDDERDLAVWEGFALSHQGADTTADARHIADLMFKQRDRLSAYGQALLALTLHNLSDDTRAATVCRNLQNTALIDRENGTATWKSRYGEWWDWYNNPTETAAWVLKAYVAILPHSDLAPMLVKWLVQNERGSQWHSTKETAMAVCALTDYIKANNELDPDYDVTVALGDKQALTYHVTRENALLFDNRFLVPDTFLPGGTQTVTITKTGKGRLYYSSALQYFTTEEHIAGVGQELKVQRRYYKLMPKTKQVADWEGGTYNALDYTRTELADGASLRSGDVIEVELVLDSKNEYDYCCFEDMKPSGCEALALRSGESYGDGLCSDMELRDTKVAFFVDHLPQGTRVLRYRLRAEVPGAFHALPTNAYAMYAPDVRALSDNWHVAISDAPAGG